MNEQITNNISQLQTKVFNDNSVSIKHVYVGGFTNHYRFYIYKRIVGMLILLVCLIRSDFLWKGLCLFRGDRFCV